MSAERPQVLSVCTQRRVLSVGGRDVHLSPTDCLLLEALAVQPRRAWTVGELAAMCYLARGTVVRGVRRLREVLGDAALSLRHRGTNSYFLVYPGLVWIGGCPWCADHPEVET